MLHHTYCYLSSKRYITLTKLIWESGVMSLNIFRNIFITKSAIMYLPKSWNMCRKQCYLSFKCYITQTKSIWKSDKVRRTSLCNIFWNFFNQVSNNISQKKSWNICRKRCYLSSKRYITHTKLIWKSGQVQRTSLWNVLEYISELFFQVSDNVSPKKLKYM